MAFTTYTMLLWTALDVLNPAEQTKRALSGVLGSSSSSSLSGGGSTSASGAAVAAAKKLAGRVRGASLLTAGVVMTTALSGAFVAGNDAGRAYNTFPDMDGEWVPSGCLDLQPAWRNAFENVRAFVSSFSSSRYRVAVCAVDFCCLLCGRCEVLLDFNSCL
jgi:heme A synthase